MKNSLQNNPYNTKYVSNLDFIGRTSQGMTLRNLCLLAIIIEGYVVLASEIIAIRLLISFVGSDTPIVAIIISAVLLPMAFGYYYGGQLYRKLANKNVSVQIRSILIRNAIIASGFLTFGLSYVVLESFFNFLSVIGIESRIVQTAIYSIIFLVTPVYLLAQTTPLISNYFKKHNLSQTAGRMLFSSTVGSFLGATLTSLLLMHYIGVNNTVIITILALSVLVLILSRKNLTIQTASVFIISLVAIALNNNYTIKSRGIVSNNQYSTIEVIDVENESEFDSRLMRINNSDSSKFTTNPDKQFIYVQFIEKFIINKLPKDKTHNILVIGAGGFSIGQDDKKNNYTYVDIDKSLLEISEELLMKQKLSDNKDFIPQPARVFLKKDNAKYDVVVLDAYSHILSIPAQLVTYEYFKDVKDRLKEKGTMVANIIAKHNFSDSWSIKVDNTIRSVFGSVNRLPLQKWGPLENKDSNVIYIGFNNAKAKKEIYTDNKNGHFLDR